MRKKIFFSFLALTMLATIVPPLAHAKSIARIYQATNIRKTASIDAPVLVRIQPPRDFEITGIQKGADGKEWYSVNIDGKKGFIASWVVTKIDVYSEEKVTGLKIILDPGSSPINLKKEPNQASGNVYQVTKKATFSVVAKTKDAQGKDWYKIDLGGKYGWILATLVTEFVTPAEKKITVEGQIAIIDSLVNIRTQPTTKSDVLTRTSKTLTPPILSKTEDDSGAVWFEVQIPTGARGWVRSDMVSITAKEKDIPVSGLKASISANVNIRADASVNSKKLGTVKQPFETSILAKKSDVNGQTWYKIKFENGFGWVMGAVIDIITTSRLDFIESGVNLRLSPSQGGKVLVRTKKQLKCKVSGASINSTGETWYLVTTEDNKTGWAKSNYVRFSGGVDLPPTNLIGANVEIQREAKLASFPSGDDGSTIYSGGKGKIDAVAIRDAGTLYYYITSSKEGGWVPAEATKKHFQPEPIKPVEVGEVEFIKRGDVVKFTIPISGKPKSVKAKSYNDNPRIQLFIEGAIFTSTVEPVVVDTALVTRVGIEQKISPSSIILIFSLNKTADYHLTQPTPTSEAIELEIFEKRQMNEIGFMLQGRPVHVNDPPVLSQNKVMVPLHALGLALGFPVSWLQDTQEADMPTERGSLRFARLRPTVKIVNGNTTTETSVAPAPQIIGSALYIPIEYIAPLLGLSYFYSPVQNTVYLDPVIEKLFIGGCTENSKTCANTQMFSQLSLMSDYDRVDLPDGRVQVTINNAVLGENAKKDIDPKKVAVDFDPRTNATPPKVTLLIVKKENEQVVFGETRNPTSFVITMREKSTTGLSGKIIILDPGHGTFNEGGTYDRGCAGSNGTLESELTLQACITLQRNLQSEGAKVILTRNEERNSKNPDLDGRVNIANMAGADMFVSVHFNASKDPEAQGTESYYYTPLGQRLAQKIQDRLVKAAGFEDRGIKRRGFYVCRKITGIPSVLLEPLFLTEQNGETWVREKNNVEKLAKAIAEGIKSYFLETP